KPGIAELSFEQELKLADDAPQSNGPAAQAEFELTITAGEQTDTQQRTAWVHAYGVPVYSIRGGTAQGDATVSVGSPPGMKLQSPRLQVLLGPNVEQSLLDALFAPPTWCQLDNARLSASADTAASDLMAALALQTLVDKSREAGHPQAAEIDARIRSTISLLVAAQCADG